MDRRVLQGLASALTLALLLTTGCGGAAGAPPEPPPTEVVIERVAEAPVEELLNAIGSVEANEQVQLRAESAGTITRIAFTEGGAVEAGALLFELDSAKENALLAQVKAEEEVARQNLERAQQLANTRAISAQELDQLGSLVEARTAARRLQEEQVSDMRILAPFAGVVGQRLVSAGQYVDRGQPLVDLVDKFKVKITYRVPERRLSQIQLGQEVRVTVSAYPDRVFRGVVDLVSPVVDEATRTVLVRAVVPNLEDLLKPGMFARVQTLVERREQSLVIPESALVASLDGFAVYAVNDNQAQLTPVELGVRERGTAEIRSGLTVGQSIVVRGTQKLVDGMPVSAAGESGGN
ncbi:MAG: efflux RND transporter periplasmic adaptor subunit [Verrucomicrobia bacterium]|nr:efflux RND transporter periplasmic adaptor subunit [Verrucomicrobiota bacterium]